MILVIWEDIPERTRMYLVDGLDPEIERKILQAHGNYVNIVSDKNNEAAAVWLGEWLDNKPVAFDTNNPDKISVPSGITEIVHSGMIL